MGSIYYVHCPATKRIKIGFTKGAVSKRVKALQTGSASELIMLATHAGTQDDERELHRIFASDRIQGEWFDSSEPLFRHLVNVVAIEGRRYIERKATPPEWLIIAAFTLAELFRSDEPETAH